MRLNSGHIRPGRVRQVIDQYGVIKCSVPGVFSDEDATDLLPPVYPFFTGATNQFYRVNVDDNVWVLFFDNNPYELFYFRRDNIKQQLSDLLDNQYKTIEVVASVDNKRGGYAQFFFTDGTGWILNSNDTYINIDKNGRIILNYKDDAHRAISIDDNGISLGTIGGSKEPAVLGDSLEKTLTLIVDLFNAIDTASSLNPHTILISNIIKSQIGALENSIYNIKSDNVTLD